MAPLDELTSRLTRTQHKYSEHHGVVYSDEVIRMSAALAERHPYLDNNPYETALDLLDEAGAVVRTRRLATEVETQAEVGLLEVVDVARRKTGVSVDELLQE